MANINGTSGPDQLVGTASPDTINGLGGDDSIDGLGGNDVLNGGLGNDLIFGDVGADSLDGGDGDDVLIDNDVFLNGTVATPNPDLQADTLLGGAGNDLFSGGPGDTFDGGSGADQAIVGLPGASGQLDLRNVSLANLLLPQNITLRNVELYALYFGASSNIVLGGSINEEFFGGGGNDELQGNGGDDLLAGEDGADLLDGGAGADVLDGGPGNDVVRADAQDTLIFGGTGFDRLELMLNADTNVGFNVNSQSGVLQRQGTFLTVAQEFEQFAFVAAPTGSFISLSTNQISSTIEFIGSASSDELTLLSTFSGVVNLGGGNDTVSVTSNISGLQLNGGPGTDLIIVAGSGGGGPPGAPGVDLRPSTLGPSVTGFEEYHFTGGSLDDRLEGGDGDDTLLGLQGADQLFGGAGDDTLNAGTDDFTVSGSNLLVGGLGSDTLIGATVTRDVFQIGLSDSLPGFADRISNFTSGTDILDLTGFSFAAGDVITILSNALVGLPTVVVDRGGDGNIETEIQVNGLIGLDDIRINGQRLPTPTGGANSPLPEPGAPSTSFSLPAINWTYAFDRASNILFIATATSGTVERFSVESQSFLTPILLGGSLGGIDIAQNGSFLLVAQQGRPVLHQVNLSTLAVSTIAINDAGYGGVSDVGVFNNNLTALVTGRASAGGSSFLPGRYLNITAPDSFTALDQFYSNSLDGPLVVTSTGGRYALIQQRGLSPSSASLFDILAGDIVSNQINSPSYVDSSQLHEGRGWIIGGGQIVNLNFEPVLNLNSLGSGIFSAYLNDLGDQLFAYDVLTDRVTVFDAYSFLPLTSFAAPDNARLSGILDDRYLLFETFPGSGSSESQSFSIIDLFANSANDPRRATVALARQVFSEGQSVDLRLDFDEVAALNTRLSLDVVSGAEFTGVIGLSGIGGQRFDLSVLQGTAAEYSFSLFSGDTIADDLVVTDDRTITVRISATGQRFANGENAQVVDLIIQDNDRRGTGAAETLLGDEGLNRLEGQGGDDLLQGLSGDDSLAGEAGDDRLEGGAGADALDGGAGRDTASYAASTAAVSVSLATAAVTGGDAVGDSFTSIENLEGSAFGDRLLGDAGGNVLIGLAGNDTLVGGDGYALSAGEGQIFRVYQSTLGRAPDAPGLDFWSGQLAGSLGLLEIAAQFIGSAEFQARFGAQDNAGFVTLLYNNVLGRAPDPGGFQFWLNELNGGRSVASMVLGFSESAEFIQGTEQSSAVFATLGINGAGEGQIFRVYQSTLGRAPDEGGFLFWTEQLAQGMSLADIVSGFTGSAEFQARFGAPDDAAFVRLLYTNVLGREPDAGGFEFYVGALGQGRARNSVVLEFSESVENQLQTTDDLAAFMRDVATGLADTLEGGAGDDVLFGGRGADTFVFRASDAGSDRVYGLDGFDTLQLIGFGLADRDAFLAGLTAAGEDVVFQNGDLTITFLDTNLETLQGVGLLFG